MCYFGKMKLSLFDISLRKRPYNKEQFKKAVSRLKLWHKLSELETRRYERECYNMLHQL